MAPGRVPKLPCFAFAVWKIGVSEHTFVGSALPDRKNGAGCDHVKFRELHSLMPAVSSAITV